MSILSLATGTWWVKPAIGGVVVLAAGAFVAHYGSTRYDAGFAEAKKAGDLREWELNERASEQISDANAKVKAAEAAASLAVGAIGANLTKGNDDAKVRADALLSSDRRLRVAATCSPARSGGGGKLPATATATGGSDDATEAYLSRFVRDRLVGRASDADNIVRQLTAAQQVIVQDRITCNGRPAEAIPTEAKP